MRPFLDLTTTGSGSGSGECNAAVGDDGAPANRVPGITGINVAPHRVQNFECEAGAGVPQTGQTFFESDAPHTSQNWAFLSETIAPQAGQIGSPCGVTGCSSLSGAPHRSQNRELLSGAGAPQFPHFLVITS